MNLTLAFILLTVLAFIGLFSWIYRTLPDDVPIMDDAPEHPEKFTRWSQE